MDKLAHGNPAPARLPRRQRRGGLVKDLPASAITCTHALARWANVAPARPSLFPDGNPRPAELVGGTPRRHVAQCALRPGHDGDHKTRDGREWS